MIVIADSSPINYLVLIEQIEVLGKLYRHVLIPEAVRRELLDDGTPSAVRDWMQQPPNLANGSPGIRPARCFDNRP